MESWGDLVDETLEGQLLDEQLGALPVLADLTECHGACDCNGIGLFTSPVAGAKAGPHFSLTAAEFTSRFLAVSTTGIGYP